MNWKEIAAHVTHRPIYNMRVTVVFSTGPVGGGSQKGGKNETGGMYLPGLFPLPFSGLHGTDHLLSGREPEKRGSSGIDQRR